MKCKFMPQVKSVSKQTTIRLGCIVPKKRNCATEFHMGEFSVKFDAFNPWDMLIVSAIRKALEQKDLRALVNLANELRGWNA